jgi:hypothetical protein
MPLQLSTRSFRSSLQKSRTPASRRNSIRRHNLVRRRKVALRGKGFKTRDDGIAGLGGKLLAGDRVGQGKGGAGQLVAGPDAVAGSVNAAAGYAVCVASRSMRTRFRGHWKQRRSAEGFTRPTTTAGWRRARDNRSTFIRALTISHMISTFLIGTRLRADPPPLALKSKCPTPRHSFQAATCLHVCYSS